MIALPFPSGSFDVVTIGYGLRNVPDLATAIDEIGASADAGRPAAVARLQPSVEPRRSVGVSRVPDGRRRGARLGPASRSRHLPLHSRVDPAVSGRRGGRPADRGARLFRSTLLPGSWRTDDHSPCHSSIDTSEVVGRGHVHAGPDRSAARGRPAFVRFASRTRRPPDRTPTTTSSATRSSSRSHHRAAGTRSDASASCPARVRSRRRR